YVSKSVFGLTWLHGWVPTAIGIQLFLQYRRWSSSYWLIRILLPSRLNSYSVFNSKISNNLESGTSRDKVPQSFTSLGGSSKTKSTSYQRSICRRITGNPIRSNINRPSFHPM